MQPSTPSGAINWQPASTAVTAKKPRYFFVVMAVLFFIIVAVGFGPNVKAMHDGILRPPWIVHLHSAVMTGWLLLFFIQTMLVAKKNVQLHRKLGLFSFGWGVAVCIMMVTAVTHMLIYNHPPEQDFLFDLVLMGWYGFITFTSFFIGGIITRRKNLAAHKRFLILATIVILQAAVDRIHFLPMFGLPYPTIYFIYLDLLFIPLMIYDWLTIGRIHAVSWKGTIFVILMQTWVANTIYSPRWHHFWYQATLPLMEQPVEVHPSATTMKSLEGYYGNNQFKIQVLTDSGQLSLLIPDQPKYPMAATSDSTWFFRTSSPTVKFRKDAAGKVTTMLLIQGYGEDSYPRLP